MRTGWLGCAGWLVAAAVSAAAPPEAARPAQVVEPLDIGFTESVEAALLFLDVEVVDADGRPMPGLRKQDFKVRLDYVARPLYSVDDLCPCDAETGAVHPDPWGDPERLRLVLESTRPRYVLYFDFSQLQHDGRNQALAAAERWVREVMREGDRVQVAAHSTSRGLERLTPFTTDRPALLAALDAARRGADYADDFPTQIWDRRDRCAAGSAVRAHVRSQYEARARGSVAGISAAGRGVAGGGDVACYYFARQEYFRIDRSLLNLRYFLAQLDELPERKVVLYFHQNATAFPGRLYSFSPEGLGRWMLDGQPSESVPDLVRLMEQVSGTATHARASVFPVVTGYGETWSVNLGANVADATGGRHNLGAADVGAVIDGAGRGCGCYYRIGFRAPTRGSHVYHVKVTAAGDKLSRKYRLQYLTEDDRWMQTAEAVLASAGDADGVRMAAALRPLLTDGGQGLEVQIAVDVASLVLELDPADGMLVGEWEAGALLVAHDQRDHWELLNASRVRRAADATEPTLVLHTRTFDDLAPGAYELRAFAHDRRGDGWGATRVTLNLPAPGEPALLGPLLVRADVRYLPSDLPTRKKNRKASGPPIRDPVRGAVPVGDVAAAGERLRLSGWVCPAAGARERFAHRLLDDDRDAEPPGSFEWWPAGACVEARLEAADLPPGAYTWRLDLAVDGAPAIEARRAFAVAAPGPSVEPQPPGPSW